MVKQMRADARCRVATPESNALPDSSALSGHVHGRTLLSAAPYEIVRDFRALGGSIGA